MPISLSAFLAAALDDHAIRPLVIAGLEPLRELTPRRAWMTSTARAPLASTHRVIDRVHGDAAVVRPLSEPARTPGLAERDVRVVGVRDLADGRVAVLVDLTNLARRET